MSDTLSPKDPSEVKDYQIDWSLVLGTDTITGTPTWAAPTGLTVSSSTATTTTATAWVTGGTAGRIYPVTCTITTIGGRTFQRSLNIRVQQL